jgi:hypothetical protein
MDDQTAKALLQEIRELTAMVAQLVAVRGDGKPTATQEIAACRASGIDLASYFKAKGAAAARQPKKKSKGVQP